MHGDAYFGRAFAETATLGPMPSTHLQFSEARSFVFGPFSSSCSQRPLLGENAGFAAAVYSWRESDGVPSSLTHVY